MAASQRLLTGKSVSSNSCSKYPFMIYREFVLFVSWNIQV